ncbi:MAG: hypothetical protein WCZ02_09710 [Lysobacterales bacterium]
MPLIYDLNVDFQDRACGRSWPALLRLWPFWLALFSLEAILWLLLSQRFGQPCAPVALAVGLTFGVGTQTATGGGWRAALLALLLTAATIICVLYAQAALHVARVLGMAPLTALANTGYAFARDVLAGLLSPASGLWLAAGLLLASLVGGGGLWRVFAALAAGKGRPSREPGPE